MDGQRNKRLACDRCRTQKLKCVRQEDSEVCQRCALAKTPCIFGVPLPPGRTPKVRAFAFEAGAEDRRSAATVFDQSNSRIAPFPPDNESSMADEPNISEKTTFPTPPSRSHQDGDSCHAGSWSHPGDENFFDMIYDDVAVEDLNSFTSRSWSTEDLLSSSQLAIEYPSDPSRDTMQLIDPGLSTEITNSVSLPSTQGIEGAQNRPFDRRTELIQSSSTPRCTVPLTAVSTMGISGDPSQSPNGPALMQKLMVLSNTMYEVQSRYTHEGDGSRNALSETFPSELAGKVLHVAMEFRDSLRSLISADGPPDSIPVSHNGQSLFQGGPASLLNQSETQERILYRHNEQYQALSDPTCRTRSDCTSLPSLSPSSLSHNPTENSYRHISAIDKPTTLQLVSNYLRLLQLYLLLFNAVHEHIRIPESIFHKRNPIWSDLSVGNATLSKFADFQIKLVLQAAERVLEEIEDTLGLAEDSRIYVYGSPQQDRSREVA